MSDNSVLSTIYCQIGLLKQTWRKNIVLLKNRSNGEYSIAKIQLRTQDVSSAQRTVRHQGKFLLETQGHLGIPLMRWVGKDGIYDILIVQKLGRTLQQHFQSCNNKFSLKTVCLLGIKTLKIIENYHERGYIHRNITPSAFQTGISMKNNQLFFNDLIDSQTYFNKKTRKHIQFKQNIKLIQINQFMSIEQLTGQQPSRKTDIEAWLLMLIYFLKGKLPWKVSTDQIPLQSKIKKLSIAINKYKLNDLCTGIPIQFQQMLTKTRNLAYQQQPTYFYYIQQLKRIMLKNNLKNDQIYDWIIKKDKNGKIPQIQRMRITKISPNIYTKLSQFQDEILQKYYQPFQENIEINYIDDKYNQKMAKKRLQTQALYEQEQVSVPDNNNNKNKQPNSALQKYKGRKQKSDCIMF